MIILAILLLIFGISKLLMLITVSKEDIAHTFTNTEYPIITTVLWLILADGFAETFCGLYILLI